MFVFQKNTTLHIDTNAQGWYIKRHALKGALIKGPALCGRLHMYQVVKREMEIPSHLLEHVARRIGEGVKQNFSSVDSVNVKVSKLNPPLGGQMVSVSVEITL